MILVEDISITFEALGRLLGTLIKWFLEELKPEGLCKLLEGCSNRNAFVETFFALYDGKDTKIFSAKKLGIISTSPKGNNGFGMNSIFIPQGYTKTWGEMNNQEKDDSSVRKIAIKKLENCLKQHN